MVLRRMAIVIAAAGVAVSSPSVAQSSADDARFRAAQERFERELQVFRSEFDRYQTVRRVPNSGYRDPRWDDGRTSPPPPVSRYQDAMRAIMIQAVITAPARNIRSGRCPPTIASIPVLTAAIIVGGQTARQA